MTGQNAYRIYPSGSMLLLENVSEDVPVLDDIEVMERMLNEGNVVYIDQETLEREWARDQQGWGPKGK